MSASPTAPDERLVLLETVVTGWRVLDLAGKQPALVRLRSADSKHFLRLRPCGLPLSANHDQTLFFQLAFTGSSIFRDD